MKTKNICTWMLFLSLSTYIHSMILNNDQRKALTLARKYLKPEDLNKVTKRQRPAFSRHPRELLLSESTSDPMVDVTESLARETIDVRTLTEG